MMMDLLPQAEMVGFPGAKHDLHLDQPEQWREAVLRFLRSTST
jgi:pimeloyl-ACP methyl ester carboxylesterase